MSMCKDKDSVQDQQNKLQGRTRPQQKHHLVCRGNPAELFGVWRL